MSATILIVDDEENARLNYAEFLAGQGYEIIGVATMAEARKHLQSASADIVLLDVQLPDGYGPNLLDEISHLPVRPPVILITAYGDIEMAVEAMINGALDFMPKPVDFQHLEKSVQRAKETVDLRRELAALRRSSQGEVDYIIGDTPLMLEIDELARRAAATSTSVLIMGETGTGKDVLANAIYRYGTRTKKSFIPVNCPAIQSTMFESELFGHEAHAFTGADTRHIGMMEAADGGVLFLDEIAAMPVDTQAKLLRALEERNFRRVGGSNHIQVDLQILAASNRDLQAMIRDGRFREDLFYRLNVLDLYLPPLRERRADIPALTGLFIQRNNQNKGLNISGITPRAMEALMAYHWPGNIRELRNAIERAMLLCDEDEIDLPHLQPDIRQALLLREK